MDICTTGSELAKLMLGWTRVGAGRQTMHRTFHANLLAENIPGSNYRALVLKYGNNKKSSSRERRSASEAEGWSASGLADTLRSFAASEFSARAKLAPRQTKLQQHPATPKTQEARRPHRQTSSCLRGMRLAGVADMMVH
mmetsp:Transcript_71079/g.154496  ORF Transcript_71079/g.154496 Transcript_71079/m.154496 type:complete len:140 (+) Transcript_71079:3-422(+)